MSCEDALCDAWTDPRVRKCVCVHACARMRATASVTDHTACVRAPVCASRVHVTPAPLHPAPIPLPPAPPTRLSPTPQSTYIRATREAAQARTVQKTTWLRAQPFFATAGSRHTEACASALQPVSLKPGDPLTQLQLSEGVVYLLEGGSLTCDVQGEDKAATRRVGLKPPQAVAIIGDRPARRDSLVARVRDWEALRDEYVRRDATAAGAAAAAAAAVAVASRRAADDAVKESAGLLGLGTLGLVARSCEAAPLRAGDEGARLLSMRLPQFIELVNPMHRLTVDWSKLRHHFTANPHVGERNSSGNDLFDEMQGLLTEQRTFEVREQ